MLRNLGDPAPCPDVSDHFTNCESPSLLSSQIYNNDHKVTGMSETYIDCKRAAETKSSDQETVYDAADSDDEQYCFRDMVENFDEINTDRGTVVDIAGQGCWAKRIHDVAMRERRRRRDERKGIVRVENWMEPSFKRTPSPSLLGLTEHRRRSLRLQQKRANYMSLMPLGRTTFINESV